MKKHRIITLLLALSLGACYGRGTDEASLFGLSEEVSSSAPVNFDTLRAQVLGPYRCLSCHTDMNNEAALISRYVRIGAPEASPLFIEVSSGRMPQTSSKVSKQREELIRRYIIDLARAPSPTPAPSPAPIKIESTYVSLKTALVETSCIRCHTTGNTKDHVPLDNYEDLKKNAVEALKNIETDLMPPFDAREPKPSAEVVQALRDWIKNGYPPR